MYTDTIGTHHHDPLPDVNVPLLRKVYERVLEESEKPAPEKYNGLPIRDNDDLIVNDGSYSMWNQNNWIEKHSCGTGGCFAGWTALLSDVEVVGLNIQVNGGSYLQWISSWAQSELGITGNEADALFAASNDISDIRYYVNALMTRVGDRL